VDVVGKLKSDALTGAPDKAIVSKDPLPKVWGVFSDTNKLMLEPDSIVDFDFNAKTKVSDFPVEEGAFGSYNKVKEPFDTKILMTKGGTIKQMEDFLTDVLTLLPRTAKLLNIVTPTATYLSATFVSYEYKQTATNGVGLLKVNCHFREVRQVAAGYSDTKLPLAKVKKPDAADKSGEKKKQPDPRLVRMQTAHDRVVPAHLNKLPTTSTVK
jgi:hypothetical protein